MREKGTFKRDTHHLHIILKITLWCWLNLCSLQYLNQNLLSSFHQWNNNVSCYLFHLFQNLGNHFNKDGESWGRKYPQTISFNSQECPTIQMVIFPQRKPYFPQINDEVVYFRHGMLLFIVLLYWILIISIDRSRIIYKHRQGEETFWFESSRHSFYHSRTRVC